MREWTGIVTAIDDLQSSQAESTGSHKITEVKQRYALFSA